MFETATIPSAPAGRRVWGACIGMTGQAAALAGLTLAYIWFPAALPKTQSIMAWLTAPAPQPPRPPVPEHTVAAPKIKPFQAFGTRLVEPKRIPAMVVPIVDPPLPAGMMVNGAMDAVRGIGDLATGLFAPPAAPAAPAESHAAEPAAAATPRRFRVGSGVKPAEVLKRVQPVYPDLAQKMRVSGAVELEGVVGLDGRIHDLQAKSGNPLLVGAALAAVSQWVFRPTRLNDEPVEVVQRVTVNFILK
ncbi:MAG TPA: energy transducer TonB [Bryobacteraceae bacterium]|nr:energy transducer TonB [Bryobacteraceae bacterium]